MICEGLAGTLSLTTSDPIRDPVAVGVKLSVMAQLFPAGSADGQVFVSLKSPVVEMPLIVSVTLPLLVRVTACDDDVVSSSWLPKWTAAGEKLTPGTACVPV